MGKNWAAMLAGVLFGIGLAVSEMTNPAKVLSFLDIAGSWDPSLAFVMGAALLVTIPASYWVLKRTAPVLDSHFHLPSKQNIDRRLLVGAAIFGIGWGLSGLCPGPALATSTTLLMPILGFLAALALGSGIASYVESKLSAQASTD